MIDYKFQYTKKEQISLERIYHLDIQRKMEGIHVLPCIQITVHLGSRNKFSFFYQKPVSYKSNKDK